MMVGPHEITENGTAKGIALVWSASGVEDEKGCDGHDCQMAQTLGTMWQRRGSNRDHHRRQSHWTAARATQAAMIHSGNPDQARAAQQHSAATVH